jgi:hypothetical protein
MVVAVSKALNTLPTPRKSFPPLLPSRLPSTARLTKRASRPNSLKARLREAAGESSPARERQGVGQLEGGEK